MVVRTCAAIGTVCAGRVGVWFPRGQRSFAELKAKFSADIEAARERNSEVEAFAFVTNQEIRLAERQELEGSSNDRVHLLHLERIAIILDHPGMHPIREQDLRTEPCRPEGTGGDGGSGRIVGNGGQSLAAEAGAAA